MASNPNILNSYLVSLGFTTDTVSYARFAAALRGASDLVSNEYLLMAKKALKFEAAAVGAFAAFGASVVGLADKVAMADQDYRLLALHMYTSLPVARELKIALDALGQPLENVMWDPELAKRFHELVADQQAMTKALGPDFEMQMYRIRDLRFEFTRLGVEVKYLTMLVVEDLAKAFGTDTNGLLGKFREFNNYVIQNLPQMANIFTANLFPVLSQTKEMFGAVIDDVAILRDILTHVLGTFFFDDELRNSAGGWRDFAKAVTEAATALAGILTDVLKIQGNVALMFDAAQQAIVGNFKGALADFSKMKSIEPDAIGHPVNTVKQFLGFSPTAAAGGGASASIPSYQQQIAAIARAFGIDPRLALALAAVESGGGKVSDIRQFDQSGKVLTPNDPNSHAMGIFQLQPGTARDMGVDATTVPGNIRGGLSYFKSLLAQYGNERAALEHYYGSPDAAKNRAYADKVLDVERGINITVNLNGTNVTPDHVKWAVVDALKEADRGKRNESQRNLAEFQQPGYSY